MRLFGNLGSFRGCVNELFQQVKRVNVDQWHRSLAEVVKTTHDMFSALY